MERFKPVKKLIPNKIQRLEQESKKRPIKEFQAIADELHRMFGWRKKKTFIYALSSKFKRPRDLYDLAKSEVYNRGLKGNRAFKYLLGILKIKTKSDLVKTK